MQCTPGHGGQIRCIAANCTLTKTIRGQQGTWAPAVGVVDLPWADRWLTVRAAMDVLPPPAHPVMPAPSGDGKPTQCPLSATEAGPWLRKLLYGSKDQLTDKRISAHSMKATALSCAAKFGLDTMLVDSNCSTRIAGMQLRSRSCNWKGSSAPSELGPSNQTPRGVEDSQSPPIERTIRGLKPWLWISLIPSQRN